MSIQLYPALVANALAINAGLNTISVKETFMQNPTLSRRQLLAAGGATVATVALLNCRFASAAPLRPGDEVLP